MAFQSDLAAGAASAKNGDHCRKCCRDTEIIFDGGDIICTECGLVLENRLISTVFECPCTEIDVDDDDDDNDGVKKQYYVEWHNFDSAAATSKSGELGNVAENDGRSSNLWDSVVSMADDLSFTDPVKQTAKEICERAVAAGLVVAGKDTSGRQTKKSLTEAVLAAACIYLACIRHTFVCSAHQLYGLLAYDSLGDEISSAMEHIKDLLRRPDSNNISVDGGR